MYVFVAVSFRINLGRTQKLLSSGIVFCLGHTMWLLRQASATYSLIQSQLPGGSFFLLGSFRCSLLMDWLLAVLVTRISLAPLPSSSLPTLTPARRETLGSSVCLGFSSRFRSRRSEECSSWEEALFIGIHSLTTTIRVWWLRAVFDNPLETCAKRFIERLAYPSTISVGTLINTKSSMGAPTWN